MVQWYRGGGEEPFMPPTSWCFDQDFQNEMSGRMCVCVGERGGKGGGKFREMGLSVLGWSTQVSKGVVVHGSEG